MALHRGNDSCFFLTLGSRKDALSFSLCLGEGDDKNSSLSAKVISDCCNVHTCLTVHQNDFSGVPLFSIQFTVNEVNPVV